MDIVQFFLEAIAADPNARTVVVNPLDFVQHLRDGLDERFLNSSSQASLMGGCVGTFRRADGGIITVYVRREVPSGDVRVGNISLLTRLQEK